MVVDEFNDSKGRLKHLLPWFFVFMPDMEVRGCDKNADKVHIAIYRTLCVLFSCPCKAADPCIKAHRRDLGHALFFICRYDGKPGLDYFDPDIIENSGNRLLFIAGE